MPFRTQNLHAWNITPREARAIQERLRPRLVTTDAFGPVNRVAGLDVGFENGGAFTRAAVAVLSYPQLEVVDTAVAKLRTSFPYVPGLLSFREIPALLNAMELLKVQPDLLLCDGQGYAHPRRFGLACHLGLLTDLPSIGVAKTRLVGDHDPVGPKKGDRVWLRHDEEILGAVLRTRDRVRPLYISIGHRICLDTALEYVLGCTNRYRLPETTRHAHRLASEKTQTTGLLRRP